jgi:hypothetical protein
MRSRIWAVSKDRESTALALFSAKDGAERYVRTLVERYSLGRTLSLHGKQLAPDAGNRELGLGPAVLEQAIDEGLDTLPGAWMVKVDETLHMVACAFSTEHKPTKSAIHYRTGIHTICEAYAATPHDALDRARKAMVCYLGKNHAWR